MASQRSRTSSPRKRTPAAQRTNRRAASVGNGAMTKARRSELLERLGKRSTTKDGLDRPALRRILREREGLKPDGE